MEKRKTQVITGEVRFSYAHVWEPSSINGGDEKYSVSIIIPKSDTKTIKAINNAIEAAKQEGIAKFGGKIPANLKLPLRERGRRKLCKQLFCQRKLQNRTGYCGQVTSADNRQDGILQRLLRSCVNFVLRL